MLVNEIEKMILKEAALTKGGIPINEFYRPTLNRLQQRRLIYIENRIVRITYKGFCYMMDLPKWTLDNCVTIPKHIDSRYLTGKPLNEQNRAINW